MAKARGVLAQADFDAIRNLVEITLDQKLDEKLEQKLEEKLNEKFGYLPTREEFYTRMDEVMTELKAIREELAMVSYRVGDHEDRIENLENIHPRGQH